jgi:hypothetical protein
MPSTAKDLRTRYGADLTLTLPSGAVIQCRRPDLKDLMFRRLLPLPIMAALMKTAQEAGDRPLKEVIAESPAMPEFIDRWVCAAARRPRIVMTFEEAGDEALWVQDMPLDDREYIVAATDPNPGTDPAERASQTVAAAEFSGDAVGGAAGSTGAPVSPAPVAVLIDGR